ncbi:hypothetical protein P3342_006241 [Pyrenophora teres f. teres]|uniref:Uncharacterized protein n=1 Tax=Pyrenophora teres f. teres (strain 0-1) TaxID=861557 RepID=E3RLY8_PYRTT|nr:hypothetical protein PTT_09416 [Pyrenophora teres f. teres 0-1]KAK1907053.1 hypothetical protein P3342_006241 [Pyrenophora teres f. teres]
MLAFTHFFASALAFHLADTAGLWPWKTAEQEELCSVYEQQAFLAANEQIRVAESLLRFSGFKVHIFLPTILISFVEFVGKKSRGTTDPGGAATNESHCDGVRAMTDALHQLKDIHPSIKKYLE